MRLLVTQFADLVVGYMHARDLVFSDSAQDASLGTPTSSSLTAPVVDHPRSDESLAEATAKARQHFKGFREGAAQPIGPVGLLDLWKQAGSPGPPSSITP